MAEKQFMLKFPGMLPPSLQDLSRLEIEMTPEVAASLAEAMGVSSGDPVPELGELVNFVSHDAPGNALAIVGDYYGAINGVPVAGPGISNEVAIASGAQLMVTVMDTDEETPYSGPVELQLAGENSYLGTIDGLSTDSHGLLTVDVPEEYGGDSVKMMYVSYPTNIRVVTMAGSTGNANLVVDGETIATSFGGFPSHVDAGERVKLVGAAGSVVPGTAKYRIDDGQLIDIEDIPDVGYSFIMPDTGKVTVYAQIQGIG